MTVLVVRSDPKNKGLRYEFDLVERPGGKYFPALSEYLETCFGNTIHPLYSLHLSEPREYAKHVAESTRDLYIRYLWNDQLHFHHELQKPFTVTFDSMGALSLSRDQEPFRLLINLRRFFSGIVHLTVKDPDLLIRWGDDRPLIKGDKKILRATDKLLKRLADQRRLCFDYSKPLPYRIE